MVNYVRQQPFPVCCRSRTQPTLLFSHGNAEDLGMIVNYFREIAPIWNVNIFAYEYTGACWSSFKVKNKLQMSKILQLSFITFLGYGLSSGTPSESNVYADAEAAYK